MSEKKQQELFKVTQIFIDYSYLTQFLGQQDRLFTATHSLSGPEEAKLAETAISDQASNQLLCR